MPKRGYSSITISNPLKEALKQEAEAMALSPQDLIQKLLDMKRGLRVPFHHDTHESHGIVYDLHYYVEVTRRDYRTLRYASKVFKKPMPQVVQKFMDQF